jgi:hypothetical protein
MATITLLTTADNAIATLKADFSMGSDLVPFGCQLSNVLSRHEMSHDK